VLEARAVIESWAASLLTRLGDTNLDHLVQILQIELSKQHTAVGAKDNVAFQESDREFHVAMVAATGNSVFAEFYSALRDRQLRIGIASLYGGDGRSEEILTQHAGIVDALAGRDASLLRQRLVAHLNSTLSAIGLAPLWSEALALESSVSNHSMQLRR
jgi:DNA-binding FadR family transcriptional regulator